MYRLTVLYGHPKDPQEFDRYYQEVHLPLAKKMRGLTGWTIGKCESAIPGERPPYYMIVGLYAATRPIWRPCWRRPRAKRRSRTCRGSRQAVFPSCSTTRPC